MKAKVFFLLFIVVLFGCSEKTIDASLYREQVAQKRKKQALAEEAERKLKEQQLEQQRAATLLENSKKPGYLSPENKEKLATLLHTSPENIQNEKLYALINEWLGTPYLWAGLTKEGVDCSAFTQVIFEEIYNIELPRTAEQMFHFEKTKQFQNKKYLEEGDLIFFRLRHKEKVISHVGIYLQNGMFIASNSPRGVEITKLNTNYWKDRYVAAGRLPINK